MFSCPQSLLQCQNFHVGAKNGHNWLSIVTNNDGLTHPAKIDLNKKLLPKQNTNRSFNIDAQGFRKTRNENPPKREIGVTS